MNAAKWIAAAVLLAAALPGTAQEKEGVALTVYNGGYGVVREVRSLDIAADGRVQFQDVAREIDATTVHFKSLTDPAAKLLEQNYQYDLVSADKLLQKYIDQPIEVVTGPETYSGTLLSFDGAQIVLQEDGGPGDGPAGRQRPRHPLQGPARGPAHPAHAGVAGGTRASRASTWPRWLTRPAG